MVKALAPAAKMMLSTMVLTESETTFLLEMAKEAIAAGSFGTAWGVQLVAVSQSPLIGWRFQVALSAWMAFSAPSASVTTMAQDRMGAFTAAP